VERLPLLVALLAVGACTRSETSGVPTCAAVKQRHERDLAHVAARVREIQSSTSHAAPQSTQEIQILMNQRENSENRFRVGMKDCEAQNAKN
jgi:hypothetical protein